MFSKLPKIDLPKINLKPVLSGNGLSKLGLRPKLLASITIMAGLSAIATVIAVLSFNSAEQQFTQFNENRVPALVRAGELAIKSNEITISASQLIGAKTEDTRITAFNTLESDVNALTQVVEADSQAQENSADMQKLQAAVGRFQSRLSDLDRLTRENLAKSENSSQMIQQLFKINNQMSFLLSPLLDKAYRELKSDGTAAANEAAAIIDRLINVDLDSFRKLLLIRSDVGSMAGAAGSFLMTNDPQNEKQFKTAMSRAGFQIAIEVDNLKEAGAIGEELHAELTALSAYDKAVQDLKKKPGFYRDSPAVSEILNNMVEAQAKIDRQLVRDIGFKFDAMALNSQEAARNNKDLINNLVNVKMIEVRNALETISTVRQYTALIVQGALSNDAKVVGSMKMSTGFVLKKFEKLASGFDNKRIADMLETLKKITTGELGLIDQRIAQLGITAEIDETIAAVQKDTNEITATIQNILANEQSTIAASSAGLKEQLVRSSWFLVMLGAAAIVASVLIGFFIVHLGILKPLSELINSTRKLAKGDLETEVHHTKRGDELGQLANALMVFRDNGLEKIRMEEDAKAVQQNVEREREENEQAKASEAAQIQFAVDKLGTGLKQLADGNLTIRINDSFVGNLDVVRDDFNQSLEKLEEALARVALNTKDISGNSHELREAATLLSNRTESQAASIEETANTLSRITEQVVNSSQKATEASDIVQVTNSSAHEASKIVQNAIEAMIRIEDTSGKISQIISLIDEIAFQTNLLALNAGVEAARAGEAGRGFAVVAQEVRELAGRTAEAAKEIKGLISTSVGEVENGVKLVKGTGDSIHTIEEKVNLMNEHMLSIANTSKEQSQDLEEINQAIRQLDDMTQQNAAMAEQTNAATQALADLATELTTMLAVFAINLNDQNSPDQELRLAKVS